MEELVQLPWDGSSLGTLEESAVQDTSEYNGVIYALIDFSSLGYELTTCILLPSKLTYSCIVDEALPLFGLTKCGTHSCKIGRHTRILVRPLIENEQLTQDIKCGLEYSSGVADGVRKLLTVRDVLGARTSRTDLMLREGVPLIYLASGTFVKTTECLLKEFFSEHSIDTILEGLLSSGNTNADENREELAACISNIRVELDLIVARCDKKFSWTVVRTVDTLTARLL